MSFLISMVITILLIAIGRDFIKKHSKLCYIITGIISILIILATYTGVIYNVPTWANTYLMPLLTKSALSTAIFVVVMYTGAFKNGSPLIKFLMPIRAELSIIASILTLSHNISFGKFYFVQLFTNAKVLSTNVLLAAIISVILIIIMIPLMITSFPNVRKKMGFKKWKKLQKTAYLFYGLIYIHVMLLTVPFAIKGYSGYALTVLVYSIVFLTYAVMRIRKEYLKKHLSKAAVNTAKN